MVAIDAHTPFILLIVIGKIGANGFTSETIVIVSGAFLTIVTLTVDSVHSTHAYAFVFMINFKRHCANWDTFLIFQNESISTGIFAFSIF